MNTEGNAFLRKLGILGVVMLLSVMVMAQPAQADHGPVDVTVTILRFEEIQDPDPGLLQGSGDYYGRVRIDGFSFQESGHQDDVANISPYWTFTRAVDHSVGTTTIEIQMWDHDTGLAAPDDIIDLNPVNGVQQLTITLDLTTGEWSGDVPNNVGWSQGDGDHEDFGLTEGGEAGRILFDISLSNDGDLDDDGIPDSVERFGVRDIGGNLVADMAALGADPCRKSIAVEVDYMDGDPDGHTHEPKADAVTQMTNAFNNAPVAAVADCPYAGFPTQPSGVNLILDVDDALTEQATLTLDSNFDTVRNANFNAARRPYFHYSVWVHDLEEDSSTSGLCCSQGRDFIVSLGSWSGQTGTARQQAGTFMHELGHSIALGHGGGDGVNYKPNYLSVMSYMFQTVGITNADTGIATLDYSRSALDNLDETNLNEAVGINDGPFTTAWREIDYDSAGGRGDGPLDWTGTDADSNGDDDDDSGVTVDINGDRVCITAGDDGNLDSTASNDDVVVGTSIHDGPNRTCNSSASGDDSQKRSVGHTQPAILTGYDDWANIKYRAAMSPDAAGGGQPPHHDDITYEEALIVENIWESLVIVDAGDDQTADEGDTVELEAEFLDPGLVPDTQSFTIDWGDGTPVVGGPAGGNGYSGTISSSHVYADNGTYTVTVEVCDASNDCGSDSFDVTVANVAPTLDPGPDQLVDEKDTVELDASFTDPGFDCPFCAPATAEDFTATVDWGDGSPVEVATVDEATGGPGTPTTGTLSGSHVYGDNGTWTVTVTVADDDGGIDIDTFEVEVDNVNPTTEIDETGTILINGIPTFLAEVGEILDFSGRSTDPGSDDLNLSWDWDDGAPAPDEETLYLVNPPNPDPFPSPSVQPRDVTDLKSHAFSEVCLYAVVFQAVDDDDVLPDETGRSDDSVNVIIVQAGNEGNLRSAGYWHHQYKGNGKTDLDDAELDCYLKVVGYMSQVFDEVRDASTVANAEDVLFVKGNSGSMEEIFDRQLLAAWLNFANGAVAYDEMIDTDGDGVGDTTFADVIAAAEAVRLDPTASRAELEAQKDILESINTQ